MGGLHIRTNTYSIHVTKKWYVNLRAKRKKITDGKTKKTRTDGTMVEPRYVSNAKSCGNFTYTSCPIPSGLLKKNRVPDTIHWSPVLNEVWRVDEKLQPASARLARGRTPYEPPRRQRLALWEKIHLALGQTISHRARGGYPLKTWPSIQNPYISSCHLCILYI